MSDTVIKIENLTKEYRLGVISHRTLYRDLQSFTSRLLKKEDPNSTVGVNYSRSRKGIFNALDNISLEIKRGDVVGIIGKNGAGKSTLLKIMSRVTGPTRGEIKIKGKIASLLEVGTGFHPELTGKENVYLNGAILGMRKHEIARKFDEIVAFSGIEKFIDTPVKRYSSGMYVRLAFAVAAHLEPEILIIDEVLAVGDAEFRKKCLGKINEVSKTGRTVLFVSHEMSALTSICDKGFLMQNGKIVFTGKIEEAVSQYTTLVVEQSTAKTFDEKDSIGDDVSKLRSFRLIGSDFSTISSATVGKKFGVEIEYEILKSGYRVNPGVSVYTSGNNLLTMTFPKSNQIRTEKGIYKAFCWFPEYLLNSGLISLRINAHTFYPTVVHFDLINAMQFEVIDQNIGDVTIDYKDKITGLIRTDIEWSVDQL